MSTKIRRHVWVNGRVQGVAYRAWTQEIANRLGIAGWVRNLPDGRVEAVFEGEGAIVQTLIQHCHQGPPAAIVTQVEVIEEPMENLQGFSILR